MIIRRGRGDESNVKYPEPLPLLRPCKAMPKDSLTDSLLQDLFEFALSPRAFVSIRSMRRAAKMLSYKLRMLLSLQTIRRSRKPEVLGNELGKFEYKIWLLTYYNIIEPERFEVN